MLIVHRRIPLKCPSPIIGKKKKLSHRCLWLLIKPPFFHTLLSGCLYRYNGYSLSSGSSANTESFRHPLASISHFHNLLRGRLGTFKFIALLSVLHAIVSILSSRSSRDISDSVQVDGSCWLVSCRISLYLTATIQLIYQIMKLLPYCRSKLLHKSLYYLQPLDVVNLQKMW